MKKFFALTTVAALALAAGAYAEESFPVATACFTDSVVVDQINGTDTTWKWNNDYKSIEFKTIDGVKTACIDGVSRARFSTIDTTADEVAVDSVVYNRVFPVGQSYGTIASTIVLPFDVPYSCAKAANFYRIAKIQSYLDGNGNKVWEINADLIQSPALANTPYFILATSSNITFKPNTDWNSSCGYKVKPRTSRDSTFSATYYDSNNGQTKGFPGTWTFKGTYEHKTWATGDTALGHIYGFAANAKNGVAAGQFVKAAAGANVPPMRGYLVYDQNGTVAAAKMPPALGSIIASTESVDEEDLPSTISVIFNDEDGNTQAIGKMNTITGEITMDKDAWFDMKGRRFNKKPTIKGTYYNQGKQVIIK